LQVPLRARGRRLAWLVVGVATAAAGAARAPLPDSLERPPGEVLRLALEARDAGELERAEALLAGLVAHAPLIADHAELLRLRLLLASGRAAEAASGARAWSYAGSPLEIEVAALLAEAEASRGDGPAARRAWRAALEARPTQERRASLQAALADSLERSGAAQAAASEWLTLWSEHPLAPEAAQAEARLAELESRLGRVLRTPHAWLERANALFEGRRNEGALAAYDRVLAARAAPAADQGAARVQRAHTLFRLRRYPEAAEAYAALSPLDEHRIARARAIARAGEPRRGADLLEEIGQRGRGEEATRAQFLAGVLFEDEGDADRARRLFALVANGGSAAWASQALWRLAWSAYRAGRYDEGIELLEKLAARETDPIERLRARYWRARAEARLGRADQATRGFSAIAREYPLSYYGWRALEHLDGQAAETAVDAPAPAIARGGASLTPDELERPRILLEAGLGREAHAELDRLFARARGLDDRLALAQLYANAGDYHQPQRLMVDAYTDPLARGPAPDVIDLWWHAWPLPYAETVRRAARQGSGLGPELVYAIMREESGYRPAVVSVSGARGLLQLMPETAEQLARGIALEGFAPDDLFSPEVNIRLGSAYLGELLARFAGRTSAAVASYNAGPQAVASWLEASGAEDDEWVEAIPYEQTRGYVKRVLRSIHAYRVLY
jgi:soluble lytic murein transglycosylase